MATNKEAMVIILDIGRKSSQLDNRTNETFLDKQKKCCMKLLQRKIFSAKNDEIALILMGTEETSNELNSEMEGYENISEAIQLSVPNWDMVRAVIRNVKTQSANADWLDALIVGMDLIKRESQAKKFRSFKIVLFTTFSTAVNDDNVEIVIQGLKKMEIDLVVISDSVEYPDHSQGVDIQSQAVFSQKCDKTEQQKQSEELVWRIIEETGGNLCNFEFAIQHLMKFQRRKARPWFWFCTLEIGPEIKIQTCSMIAVKEEQHFKWETESGLANTRLYRVHECYKNGEKIESDKEDLIKAYLLGTTPIPFDESLGMTKEPTHKGLKCIGFTARSVISDEFMAGNGSYIVLPKKGQECSEKMFAALVQAMIKVDVVMTAQKVHANGGNKKLVVLIPNTEHEYPCLTMIELYYADQYCRWFFPPLRTKKTEPSAEQSAAVEKLIDSMDLTNIYDDKDEPKELFPIKNLTHISLQHIYETVTKRALNPKQPVPTLDGRLAEALEIPQRIKEKSADAVKEIKELFHLQEVKKSGKRELIRKLGDIPALPDGAPVIEENLNVNGKTLTAATKTTEENLRVLVEVGTVTPAKDFMLLADRGEDFSKISQQIRNIIQDLIFKSMTDQNEKIAEAMMTFREQAKFFGPWEYNDWIKELKTQIISRKKFDFWEKVVIKDELGLIPISESDLVSSISDEEAEEFYRIGGGVSSDIGKTNVEDESIDDLLENM